VDSAVEREVASRAGDLIEAASDMSHLHRNLKALKERARQQRHVLAALANAKRAEAVQLSALTQRRRALSGLEQVRVPWYERDADADRTLSEWACRKAEPA
jgi:hypothetical protein